MMNIHGEKGIGKTSFVKELLKFLTVRDIISNNIYFYDFEKEETLKKLKELIKENKNFEHSKEYAFYVLDSIDQVEDNCAEF